MYGGHCEFTFEIGRIPVMGACKIKREQLDLCDVPCRFLTFFRQLKKMRPTTKTSLHSEDFLLDLNLVSLEWFIL